MLRVIEPGPCPLVNQPRTYREAIEQAKQKGCLVCVLYLYGCVLWSAWRTWRADRKT